MPKLELTDQYRDRILITGKPDEFVYISTLGSEPSINNDDVTAFEVGKGQAIQIIKHLKECFQI